VVGTVLEDDMLISPSTFGGGWAAELGEAGWWLTSEPGGERRPASRPGGGMAWQGRSRRAMAQHDKVGPGGRWPTALGPSGGRRHDKAVQHDGRRTMECIGMVEGVGRASEFRQ
jgi:hypothetical protein